MTFGTEFTNFVNVPFPLEFAAIAPFYSNIDTSTANESSIVSFVNSKDPEIIQRASEKVRESFSDASDFEALSVFIATWRNVGHYMGNNEKQNTFQVRKKINHNKFTLTNVI